jgi:hypothetical protein
MRSTYIDQVDLNLLPPLVALLEERHVSRTAERANSATCSSMRYGTRASTMIRPTAGFARS